MTDGQTEPQSSAKTQEQERKQREQERKQQEQERNQPDKPLSTEDMANAAQKGDTAAMGPATRISPGAPETARAPSSAAPTTARPAPLLKQDQIQAMRTRWTNIQAGFVDEPRSSVEHADALVAELMQQLAQTFAAEKNNLEGQWERGQEVSTEDLRVALQHYRSFFDRLLSF
jgi:hypothetical protein